MAIFSDEYYSPPVVENGDGTIKHVHGPEGCHYHVIWWIGVNHGENVIRRCSEPRCEINKESQ